MGLFGAEERNSAAKNSMQCPDVTVCVVGLLTVA